MAFSVSDFNDLKQLLAAHPEWRVELRDLLLSEDFQALPAIVRELVEAQRRTDQRLAELAEQVAQLVEAQRRTDQRLAELADQVAQLAEAQRRTDQRLAELAEAQRRTDQRLAELAEQVAQLVEAQRRTDQRLAELAEAHRRLEVRVARIEDKVGGLQGREMESRYRQRAAAYFGRWFRGIKVVDDNDLIDRVESHLGPDELQELLATDLVVRGRALHRPERPEVWLAVEISSVVDRSDVVRAVRRAELLRRTGLPALPVVAGENATAGAEAEARALGVALLQDGFGQLWDEAFTAWPA